MQGKLGVMKLRAVGGRRRAPMAGVGGVPCRVRLNSYQPQGAAAAMDSV